MTDYLNFDFNDMQLAADEVGKKFEPISAGHHDVQVTTFVFKTSKKGFPMFEVEFTVDNGNDVGKSVKSWFVLSGDGARYSHAKLFWLFEAAGIRPISGQGERFATQFKPLIEQGKFRLNAKVIHKEREKYNGDGEKETVAEIVFTSDSLKKAVSAPTSIFARGSTPNTHSTPSALFPPSSPSPGWDVPTDVELPF